MKGRSAAQAPRCAARRKASFRSLSTLRSALLAGEEMPHCVPDVVVIGESVTAAGEPRGRELRKEPPRFGGKLPCKAGGHLDVPGIAGRFRDGLEGLPRLFRIARGVVAIRGV